MGRGSCMGDSLFKLILSCVWQFLSCVVLLRVKREGRRIASVIAAGAQRRRRGYVLLAPPSRLVAPV